MNIGPAKGGSISELISAHRPTTMIEFGGYVGYSAVLFGDAIRVHGGQYLSLEKNVEMAAVANQLVELAGLRDTVKIVVGSADKSIVELLKTQQITHVQMIFLDHWQELYLPDLWLLESLNILRPFDSVIIADNVIMPGAPRYLEWVQANTGRKKILMGETDTGDRNPNPNLVYETIVTEFETQFGNDGVAVTKVTDGENS